MVLLRTTFASYSTSLPSGSAAVGSTLVELIRQQLLFPAFLDAAQQPAISPL